ncbi:MAG: nucleotidyltransferase domain-containing protein [Nanoarchaeota archaeon]|nr:nucleotidyltransferase domain-containing protein [Nanoarchaeota archaeon]
MKFIPNINCKIPSSIMYNRFVDILQEKLLNFDEVSSVFCYGSTARGTQIPGKSDIDAVFVLKDLINKPQTYTKLGGLIQETHNLATSTLSSNINSSKPIIIPLQFSFADSQIAQDGRFITYTPDFLHQFESETIELKGDGFDRKKFKMNSFKLPLESRIGFNLAKMRQKRVFLETIFGNSLEDKIRFNQSCVDNYLRAISEIANMFVEPKFKKTQRASNSSILKEYGVNRHIDFDFIEFLKEQSTSTSKYLNLTQENYIECVKCLSEFEKLVQWYLQLETQQYKGLRIPVRINIESTGLIGN